MEQSTISLKLLACGIVCALATTLPGHGWTPGTGSPTAVDGFVVDTSNRRDVLSFYQCVYTASESYASKLSWTGNVPSCIAGTTGADFKEDVRRRINFFRALVGHSADITFNATKSAKAQEAALMMAANNSLSHTPPSNWSCYTANGYEAAGASNLALGNYGPAAVNAYLRDDGTGNEVVGHRRWILYSRAQIMGTGDVPAHSTYNHANAIWCLGDFKAAPAAKFTSWPNEGYVPVSLVPARWSLSYPGASFASATVTMTQNGSPVTTSIISNNDVGYGDNSLVWAVTGLPSTVTNDTSYQVTVNGISGGGAPSSKTYTVTLFNPDILGDSVTIAGTNNPPTSGQAYTMNAIAQADSYQLVVSSASTAAWTEGAEDTPAPNITENISAGYTLLQTGLKRTGSKAFQLAHPSGAFSDQSFIVTRSIVPTASSSLTYYDRARFTTTTTTLVTQISTDGTSWTDLTSRNGVGLSSGNWDNWTARSVNLSAYAGQLVQFRFIMKANGLSVAQIPVGGTVANFGFFIDDITVTNASQLTNDVTTTLAANATGFTLNASTAGSALVVGNSYIMRVRPQVGCKWFGYGALKTVTAVAPTGYAAWVTNSYPTVTGGFDADHDKDGIANGVEYAFQLNPTQSTSSSTLPQAIKGANTLSFSYSQPGGVSGITYGAQSSEDLVNWTDVTDTGSGNNHVFSVSTTNKNKVFLRHKILLP